MYNFPERWHLNIKNIKDLSKRLGFSVEYLKKFEVDILNHYILTKILQNGKPRDLCIPSKPLKRIQQIILKEILNFDFPKYVQGGVRERSIIKNALIHRQKKWVATLDISKFFPSVHYSRIRTIFSDLGCSEAISKTLTHFVTYPYELPQGVPTSPVIANLVLYNLDCRIFTLCKIKKLNYSRYFDDITISGNRRLDSVCEKIIKTISKKEGFKIKLEKFIITSNSKFQVVTGFIVNGRNLEVSEEFLHKLENYINELKNGKMSESPLYEIFDKVNGMIAFLKSVQPKKAKFLSKAFEKIDWGRYGFDNN